MADDENNAITAPFPAPPPFYKHFTEGNLAQLEETGIDGATTGGDTVKIGRGDDVAGSQSDLRYLVPPKPPESGSWTVFGQEYNLSTKIRSLEENGIPRLYPAAAEGSAIPRSNHNQIVIHVVRSILLNFLELADVLAKDPQDAGDKIGDLQTLFYNAHHLLNEYRPHQARETLISIMQDRIDGMRSDIQDVKDSEVRINEMLGNLGELGADGAQVEDMERRRAEQLENMHVESLRSMWRNMRSVES